MLLVHLHGAATGQPWAPSGPRRILSRAGKRAGLGLVKRQNTTLKQRVRQLTAGNRNLDERLKAARSNLRFQNRRVAALEARIADPEPPTVIDSRTPPR